MSLLHDLAREYQAALVGFGQVFLVSGMLVALGYWMKASLMRKLGRPTASKPKRRQSSARKVPPKTAAPKAISQQPASGEPAALHPAPAEIVRVSPELHSQRAAAPVRQVFARGELARDLHQRALIRLESADYAFQRLLLDIAEVISLPQTQEPGDFSPPPAPAVPEQVRRLAA